MKRRIFWFFILSLIIFHGFNMFMDNPAEDNTDNKKMFIKKSEDPTLKSILKTDKSKLMWENYKSKTLKSGQIKNLKNYIKNTAEKNNISTLKIKLQNKHTEHGLLSIPIALELTSEYKKIINFINDLENTDLFLTVKTFSINKNNDNNLLTSEIFLEVQLLEFENDKYSSTSLKALSSISKSNYYIDIRNPF